MLPQQYCLRWKYHHSNLQTMFSQLLDRGCFCDVTLACEGQLIRAHRVVLCACSTFFDQVLTNYASERDPIIIMKDVTFADIKCLIEFMYKGEINVEHSNLTSLLKTADDLKIKGLAEVTWRDEDEGPLLPTAQTEFYSPKPQQSGRDDSNYESIEHRGQTPEHDRDAMTPPGKRMPILTPMPPTAAVSIVLAESPVDTYLGPKRKRGRPPLDDAYDVFNVRKLAQYSTEHNDHVSFMEGSQYREEQNTSPHSRADSPSAAVAAYQQHVQQQKQRLRYKHERPRNDDANSDDDAATEPEWINSSLENEQEQKVFASEKSEEIEDRKIAAAKHDENAEDSKDNKRSKETTPEYSRSSKSMKRKSSKEENAAIRDNVDDSKYAQKQQRDENEGTNEESSAVPQTVEEIETGRNKASASPNASKTTTAPTATTTASPSAASPPTSSSTSTAPSSSAASKSMSSSSHSHHQSAAASSSLLHHAVHPPPLHHPHFGKFVPEGYLINEHGILMTHDFIHAPTASIPASALPNGLIHPDDYVDIKMEEFNEAELRLTSEEMSQWQDVIKMDDYLAKGRRPQFWEEPFTRRVLDAIKNKRLEMKKAARILGVSYGTLYGRYREVYGCLKHPYSATSLRPQSSSGLGTMQPRFDIVWPSPKPGQLDIGKLRPKDLSELWTRPQI